MNGYAGEIRYSDLTEDEKDRFRSCVRRKNRDPDNLLMAMRLCDEGKTFKEIGAEIGKSGQTARRKAVWTYHVIHQLRKEVNKGSVRKPKQKQAFKGPYQIITPLRPSEKVSYAIVAVGPDEENAESITLTQSLGAQDVDRWRVSFYLDQWRPKAELVALLRAVADIVEAAT